MVFILTHSQISWKIQMQIPKWKQKKYKELKYAPLLATLQGGKKDVLEL